jgi:hypothetical protein
MSYDFYNPPAYLFESPYKGIPEHMLAGSGRALLPSPESYGQRLEREARQKRQLEEGLQQIASMRKGAG